MQSKWSLRNFSMVIALALIWAFFALQSETAGTFLSARNMAMLAIELSITAVLALGMLVIILPGHIDLSAGSGVGLLGGIASVLITRQQFSSPAGMLVAFMLGVMLWSAMGALIVWERIPSFIITLSGMLIFRGLFWLVIENSTIAVAEGGSWNYYSLLTTYYLPPHFGLFLAAVVVVLLGYGTYSSRKRRLAQGVSADDGELAFMKWFVAAQAIFLFVLVMNQYRGIPLSALILGLTTLTVHILIQHTRFGRALYAIGGNEEAARISGIPVERVVILAFALMGAIVALTGLLQTAYAGSSTTTIGTWAELDAVAACVIGGASLKGGRGTVLGVLFGALIMASLLNGMTLMAVSPEAKYIARGVVLALAVWLDVRLARAQG